MTSSFLLELNMKSLLLDRTKYVPKSRKINISQFFKAKKRQSNLLQHIYLKQMESHLKISKNKYHDQTKPILEQANQTNMYRQYITKTNANKKTN